MTPEPSFVRDLAAYDPLLRVRWGRHTERWIIERKLPERNPAWRAERPLNPFGTGKRKKDLWEGWRQGYVHVLSVHPALLNWRTVAPALADTDREQAGSWDALNRKMDEAEAAEEAARQKAVTDWSESASKDAADTLFWRQGHTVATPRTPSEVASSDRIETRDGFTIRVRKGAR